MFIIYFRSKGLHQTSYLTQQVLHLSSTRRTANTGRRCSYEDVVVDVALPGPRIDAMISSFFFFTAVQNALALSAHYSSSIYCACTLPLTATRLNWCREVQLPTLPALVDPQVHTSSFHTHYRTLLQPRSLHSHSPSSARLPPCSSSERRLAARVRLTVDSV